MSVSLRLIVPALAASLILLPQSIRAQALPQAPSGVAPSGAAPAGTAPATKPLAPSPVAPKAANSTISSTQEGAQKLITTAVQQMAKNDADGALASLTKAIALNPTSTGAYVLRASIYCQRHQFAPAEDDFNAASRIAPTNVVLKFNLAEVKFMQKQYDLARPGFAALEQDKEMGDFATYKVFLCDLYGGHQDAAKKQLKIFDDAMGDPSYYFANAAWDLYYKNVEDARTWLLSASRIYPAQKFTMYGQSLRDLGYLPIPEPKATP